MKLTCLMIMISQISCFPGYIDKLRQKHTALRIKLPVHKPSNRPYNPSLVDWNGVISGCRAACVYEKRLCNFYIRAAAHDSLSVSEGHGGADGSLLLTEDELKRSENSYDNFAFKLSKNALALATKYGSSVADVVAVCGAVATEFLGGPTIVKHDASTPFMVGRFDKTIPNPTSSLAPANLNTTGFAHFAIKRGFALEEMVALMGSHALIDEKACLRKDRQSLCDPFVEDCTNISMYTWDNSYFLDTCSKLDIFIPPKTITSSIDKTFLLKQELCKFTGKAFKDTALQEFTNEPPETDAEAETETVDVEWSSTPKTWPYTLNDAWLGKACMKDHSQNANDIQIEHAMNKFRNSSLSWDLVYIKAYKKMVNLGAKFSTRGGYPITGHECPSGYRSLQPNTNCKPCNMNYKNFKLSTKCHTSCQCSTSFAKDVPFYQ